jgi:hypothetical protein
LIQRQRVLPAYNHLTHDAALRSPDAAPVALQTVGRKMDQPSFDFIVVEPRG